MSEDDPLDPELIARLESLSQECGFANFDRISKTAVRFYGRPQYGGNVIDNATSIIAEYGLVAQYEASYSNAQYFTFFIYRPDEYEHLTEPISQWRESFWAYMRLREQPQRNESGIVPGSIGANIGGRTHIYVKGSDNEDLYVTLEGSDRYIECDATELPEGIKIYLGFPVMVDKGKRVIIGPREQK